jgi:hypothetical protein
VSVKTEYLAELNRLVNRATITRTVFVNDSEDVLAHVRMGIGFGWAPEWYRTRKHVRTRILVKKGANSDQMPITRNIYLHRVVMTTGKSRRHFQLSKHARAFWETLEHFFDKSSESGSRHRDSALDRQHIDLSPKDIVCWAEENPLPFRHDQEQPHEA